MPDLKIDWATHKAAKYAVMNWHYSQSLPRGKLIKFGVWENHIFIGVVVFARGATLELLKPYGLKQTNGCELARIALNKHKTPVSKIISIVIRMLAKHYPALKIVVSFADCDQCHTGIIYQASNWIYTGESKTHKFLVNGRTTHPKTLHTIYGIGGQSIPWLKKYVDPNVSKINGIKYRYLMPLDKEVRKQIEPLAKEYPRSKQAMAVNQQHSGGVAPTTTLQKAELSG